MEEFGVTDTQESTYTVWWDTVISSGLTGDLIWQAGSNFSSGDTPNDGYAVSTSVLHPIFPVNASFPFPYFRSLYGV
jgi:mannan endo-1,4-beta-mannosidase